MVLSPFPWFGGVLGAVPLLRKINDAGQAAFLIFQRSDLLGGLIGVDHPGQDEEVLSRDLVVDPGAVGAQQVGQVVQLALQQALAFLAIESITLMLLLIYVSRSTVLSPASHALANALTSSSRTSNLLSPI